MSHNTQLAIGLENAIMITYSNLASVVLLLYDHILTLELEIELVWPSPWSLGKVLYFSTTYSAWADCVTTLYLSFAGQSVASCTILNRVLVWSITLSSVLAEAVMVFRTWALWGRGSKVVIYLTLVLMILAIPCLVSTDVVSRYLKFEPNPRPGVDTCWLVHGSGGFLNFLLLVTFESIILALTIFKIKRQLRTTSSHLMLTLYHDGVLFYVYLIGFSLINMAVILESPTPGPSFVVMQRMLQSILTKRIMLNLREAASRDRVNNTQWNDGPVSSSSSSALSSVIIGVDTWFVEDEEIDSIQDSESFDESLKQDSFV